MGRKRMAETTVRQEKTSNDCSETTIAILEKQCHSSCANTSEAVNAGNNVHSQKKSNKQAMDVVVRRSCRILNSAPRSERPQMNSTMGHINVSESKGEEIPLVQLANTGPVLNQTVMGEELPHVQPVVTAPILNHKTVEAEIPPHVPSVGTVSIVNDKSLVDKFEFLVKVFGEYVSKTDKQVNKALNEGSSTDLNYKSLYIGSQKKMECLMEENFHLSGKLEFALGKVEAYEKMMGVMCASKEVVFFPSPSPLKKHASQSIAAPLGVIGHETSPTPKKEPKKRTPKKALKKRTRESKKKNVVSF